MIYAIACVAAFLIMFVVTPHLIRLANKTGYMEKPRPDLDRKLHKEPKPYLASLGMFGGFWLVYLIFTRAFEARTVILFCSSLLILLIGMLDDWYKISGKDLRALPKFIIQLSACVAVYFAGFVFMGVNNPFNDSYIIFPVVLQFLLTVFWIFGITTVINFTDGMDGLSGGIVCISATTMFVVALVMGQTHSAMKSAVLVGICIGYLKYNRFPSKILMGDAGATFLGFMLAIIALDGAFKQATVISIFVPVLAFGVPIFDNLYVIVKRIKEGRPFYIGDATQAHFRLLSHGLTQRQTVYILYLISICLNLSAVILFMIRI